MPRAYRLQVEGRTFHLIHRCHNRAFLIKFAKDHDAYRARVGEKLQHFDLSLLDSFLTCNHVHLIVDALDRLQVSGFMREVAGEFARQYNHRKGRLNAVWGDNLHTTLIDTGLYLWRCLCSVELNMVRARAVTHPDQWEWVSYHEIMGRRQRYRLLDLDRLCWRLQVPDLPSLREHLKATLLETMARDELKREACWTESLPVGSPGYLERVKPLILSRQETEIVEEEPGLWVLNERETPYRLESDPKEAAKASKQRSETQKLL